MSVSVHQRLRRPVIHQPIVMALAQTLLHHVTEPTAELNVEFVGSRRMRRLNREYRGVDAPTDVLAFAFREAPGPVTPLLGDVVIAWPMVLRQAQAFNHSVEDEVMRLLIHGTLHLVGYDHERGAREARRMRRAEERLWRALRPFPPFVVQQERPSRQSKPARRD